MEAVVEYNFKCAICRCKVKKYLNTAFQSKVTVLRYCKICLINHIYGRQSLMAMILTSE
jgi:hypothetical protein